MDGAETGESETKKEKSPRRMKIKRFGCNANIVFKRGDDGKYIVHRFHEGHTHELCSLKYREFQKLSRNLTFYHKQTIVDNCRVNIGPTMTFRQLKEYSKGYENVGGTLTDFKNFGRDVKCFIGGRDAQMFIDNLKKRADMKDGFYYAYEVNEEDNLCRVFWADAISRKNYAIFGDAVSYDPTYGTNKYSMVFTPFTGVDNNLKSITFASALLSNEDEESFKWVFERFLDAMGRKEPQCLFTDQDPAVKNVVPKVFQTAKHRFCMWHITEKVAEKVGKQICKETGFLDRFHSIVWDINLEPLEFQHKWTEMIIEFELEGNSWLSKMFSVADMWIPVFFKDLPMACILRTTQRSESENSFFKRRQSQYGTLVEFWMRQSAMDQQRYGQKVLNQANENTLPETVNALPIEKHASRVYTHNIFYDFQEEASASVCGCGVAGFTRTNEIELSLLNDSRRRKTFEVRYNTDTGEATCSCKLFIMKGLLCRHIISVFSGKGLTFIPEQYIANRWTKDALKKPTPELDVHIFKEADGNDSRRKQIVMVWSEFHETMACLDDKEEKDIKALGTLLKQFRERLDPIPQTMTKEQELEKLLGCKANTEVTILPPKVASNKGSGSTSAKRLISKKTKAIKEQSRALRLCANCHQMAYHDKRTCPYPAGAEPPEPLEKEHPLVSGEKLPRLCNNCKQMGNHDKRNCPLPKIVEEPTVTVRQETTPFRMETRSRRQT